MTREATNRILTLIADGVLSAETVLNECLAYMGKDRRLLLARMLAETVLTECLAYMSEDDVAEMARLGGFFEDEDEDEDEDDDGDEYGGDRDDRTLGA
jgi:hypothetical protein